MRILVGEAAQIAPESENPKLKDRSPKNQGHIKYLIDNSEKEEQYDVLEFKHACREQYYNQVFEKYCRCKALESIAISSVLNEHFL